MLVAAYSFDNGAVVDVTGRGHDGTLFNTPTFPAGRNGLGIEFDSASSEYAQVADHADFTLGSAWTIMCWVNPTTVPASELVCKQNQWWFSIDGGFNHGFYKSGGGTASVLGLTAVTTGTWQHAACRYDGMNLQVVRNGVQNNTSAVGAFTMIDNTNPVRMGTWEGSTEFLDGILDDIRIYNEYLSDAQITALMNTPVIPVIGYQRLIGPLLLSTSAATLYSVPTGRRATISHVRLVNNTSSPVDVTMSIGADAAGTRIWDSKTLEADRSLSVKGPFTMEAGEVFQAFAGTSSAVTITLLGRVYAI